MISIPTFYRHQEKYLFPLVLRRWDRERAMLRQEYLQRGGLELEGDARSDSPGHR